MTETIHFEPVEHKYTLLPSGLVLPSVSTIIRPLTNFDGIPERVLNKARDRGTAVHKGCELFDLGTLDTDDLDEQLVPYVNGWAQFISDWQPMWTEIEQVDYHKTLLYAGTPDRRGYTTHRMIDNRIVDTGIPYPITVDTKATYDLNPAVQVQLTGYALMDGVDFPDELWSVRLLKTGGYVRTVHEPAISTFMSCLNVYQWLQRNT